MGCTSYEQVVTEIVLTASRDELEHIVRYYRGLRDGSSARCFTG